MEYYGLSNNKLSLLRDIFSRYDEIDQVLIYGSRAKGNYDKFSDVDITLVAPTLTRNKLTKIIFDIEDLLFPYEFDVSIFHMISNSDVISHINRVGKVLYSKADFLDS